MKKFNMFKTSFLASLLILISLSSFAQSLTHPHIWIKDSEKGEILEKINNHSWANKLLVQYKGRVDATKNSHKLNPATVINSIPAIPGSRTSHRNILTLGYDAALLYWLTGNDDYGQLAADILYYYTKTIAKISGNVEIGANTDFLIQAREPYTKPPMIYDFVYSFLKKPGATVYDRTTQTRVPFNFTDAQTTFKKLADQVFSRGGMNNNHPVLEAPGALFNLLCIEDDATRRTYVTKFMNGTNRQNGLNWMLNHCSESGLWPESTGYSAGPHRIILQMMEIVDRYDSTLKVVENNKLMLENAFLYENYRFPDNNSVMRFGDAHRTRLNSKAICERVLTISNRKGYESIKQEAVQTLKSLYNEDGGFNPSVATQTLEWNNPLYLLWALNVDITGAVDINYASAFSVGYAGLAMQRNLNTSNTVEYGLMGYTGGAHYVHSHLSGIDMELYGLGAVLGTGGGDVGAANRGDVIFRNYHRIYAGHNTVIINGKSKGGGANSWKSDGQLYMNKTKTIAAEPASYKEALSEEFSFSSQELDDGVNNAKQQRVFSIIRTGNKTGYYFDLFRSKSLGSNVFHDYVYHNIGNGATMVDAQNNPIDLSPKTGRYVSTRSDYGGKYVMFPGWHYFEDVKTSDKTNAEVKATFALTKSGTRYMHMLMPGGEEREYTTCKGPATIEGQLGYDKDKTPIVTVRHYGEAWTKPFVSIFEPTRNANGSVRSVNNLYNGSTIVGAKVVSLVEGKTITDYIISNINNGETFTLENRNIAFKGRFGIVRTVEYEGVTDLRLYIGQGDLLSYDTITLVTDASQKGLLEKLRYRVSSENSFAEITSPLDTMSYLLGDTINFEANALSTIGTIEKVLFKVNGNVIGEDTAAPYAIDWIPSSVATYIVEVEAYDSNDEVAYSAPVEVSVVIEHSLTVTSDNGTVTQSDEGSVFEEGTTIELTAVANSGYEFESWSGDYIGTENPISIKMDSSINITANYSLVSALSAQRTSAIVVFPNPCNGKLSIKVDGNQPSSYKLYSIDGSKVLQGTFNAKTTIYMNKELKGLFLLDITTKSKREIHKIMVE